MKSLFYHFIILPKKRQTQIMARIFNQLPNSWRRLWLIETSSAERLYPQISEWDKLFHCFSGESAQAHGLYWLWWRTRLRVLRRGSIRDRKLPLKCWESRNGIQPQTEIRHSLQSTVLESYLKIFVSFFLFKLNKISWMQMRQNMMIHNLLHIYYIN